VENLGGETPAKRIFLHFMDKNAENRIFLPRPGEKTGRKPHGGCIFI